MWIFIPTKTINKKTYDFLKEKKKTKEENNKNKTIKKNLNK